MFVAVSPMVSMCLDRAREAHQEEAEAADRKFRGFWHEMELRRLVLAQGYEMSHVVHAETSDRGNGRVH